MAQFTISSTNIVSGAERRGTPQDPPDRVTKLSVQLVDTDGQWGGVTDPVARTAAGLPNGTVSKWGVQMSADDGTYANAAADWDNEGSVSQTGVPFGARAKDGSMAKLIIDATPFPVAQPNVRCRLAIQVTTTIRLGAQINTNADA